MSSLFYTAILKETLCSCIVLSCYTTIICTNNKRTAVSLTQLHFEISLLHLNNNGIYFSLRVSLNKGPCLGSFLNPQHDYNLKPQSFSQLVSQSVKLNKNNSNRSIPSYTSIMASFCKSHVICSWLFACVFTRMHAVTISLGVKLNNVCRMGKLLQIPVYFEIRLEKSSPIRRIFSSGMCNATFPK